MVYACNGRRLFVSFCEIPHGVLFSEDIYSCLCTLFGLLTDIMPRVVDG